MKLTVLCDNNTYIDAYYLGEPGFSCLIEDEEQVILFDAGYSDVFIQNADRMGIDLGTVTDIVLSHGHNDHTGGLAPFFARFHQPVRLYAHPSVFDQKRLDGLSIGSPLSISDLPGCVTLHLSKKPIKIAEHVTFLGEIPRRYPFEEGRIIGEYLAKEGWTLDSLHDDSALALSLNNGVFIVSGCSHSGICNISARALEQLHASRIIGILGGLHLFKMDSAARESIRVLKAFGVEQFYPAHCTGLPVKAALLEHFQVHEVGVSLQLQF